MGCWNESEGDGLSACCIVGVGSLRCIACKQRCGGCCAVGAVASPDKNEHVGVAVAAAGM